MLALPGDITAFEDSPVYARVNGYVRNWTVDIGARVKAGQLLAEIETPELHEQLKQAQALVLQAKANAEIARINSNRYVNLVKTNAVSQQDVDNARANGSITMYDTKGTPIAKWELTACWPSKLTGPAGKADANEVAVQELTLTHEGYKRVQ